MKNNKSLGQHWLYNREILQEIAELTGGGERCVEIGPGLGTLTASLFKCFDKVVAVEFDARLAANLPGSFPGKNLEVVEADFLQFDLDKVPAPYKIAGNIPYYITSPIIERILTAENLPEKAVLLVQKEVAERVADHKKSTALSLWVENRSEVGLGPVVKKAEFTPPPKVDSQVLVLTPRKKPLFDEKMFKLVKIGFSSPRKKLVHNLAGVKKETDWKEILAKQGLNPDARPADLTLEDWYKLWSVL